MIHRAASQIRPRLFSSYLGGPQRTLLTTAIWTRMVSVSAFPCVPPPGSLAAWYKRSDFVDSFAVRLPKEMSCSAGDLTKMMLGRPPIWVRGLLWLRDTIMWCFGVKTTQQVRSENDGRSRIDFFPVVSESHHEIVVGEEDMHLDFRASFLLTKMEEEQMFVATTVVRRHNLLGRFYLWMILPFHRVIVTDGLRRLGKQLGN
jgi:hypothetical protein